MDIEKEYNVLKTKYNLPPFKFLKDNFEILYNFNTEYIPKEDTLIFIRRRINDKLVWICNFLQSIIMPNPSSLINIHEEKFYSKEDKEKILNTLQRLMKLERETLLLDINLKNEKENVLFIKKITKEWPDLLKELSKYADILHKGWLKTEKEDFHNYFG